MSRGEWLVPLKGRSASGVYNQNFLWRDGTVYVMDNHRAAMWCWLQDVDPSHAHSLFHMDRHYDCLPSPEWLENCPEDIRQLSIDEYLNFDYAFDDFGRERRIRLFRWDNYLSIYLARYRNSIDPLVMYTHNDGAPPAQLSIQGIFGVLRGKSAVLMQVMGLGYSI
jgi:virulence-associated protein VapD